MAKSKVNDFGARTVGINYFYINGKLHRKIAMSKGSDTILTWSYMDERRMVYPLSEVRKKMQQAFTTGEVCAMLGRNQRWLRKYYQRGYVPYPQAAYSLNSDMTARKTIEHNSLRKYILRYSEEDVMRIYDYIISVHPGRLRKDGFVRTPKGLPSRTELRAIMRRRETIYVKTAGGEFVPLWKQPDWS